MNYRIVVNVTEHDPMHARLFKLTDVSEVAAAGANNVTVALVWECPDEITATAQTQILWGEMIPARILHDDVQESAMVNLIIENSSQGIGF